MEEPVNNEIDLENVESSQDMITSDIKQFVKLRESSKNSDKKVNYLKKQLTNLTESNCNIEANLNKLEQNVFDTDAKVLTATKTLAEKKQELKDLESARTKSLSKQWDNCLSDIGNYANDFSKWITEYSRDVLMKDIEDHQKECRKVATEVAILKQDVDDVKNKYDLNFVKANVDVADLSHLDSVISDIKSSKSKLKRDITSAEDTLNKVQKKLKQYKVAVNEYKTKKNTNMG